MKMRCECGGIVVDQTDFLPWKAHLIPDQDWFGMFDEMDRILSEVAGGGTPLDHARMAVRSAHSRVSRNAYQCARCGLLFLTDRQGRTNVYTPASDADSRRVLEGHGPLA